MLRLTRSRYSAEKHVRQALRDSWQTGPLSSYPRFKLSWRTKKKAVGSRVCGDDGPEELGKTTQVSNGSIKGPRYWDHMY